MIRAEGRRDILSAGVILVFRPLYLSPEPPGPCDNKAEAQKKCQAESQKEYSIYMDTAGPYIADYDKCPVILPPRLP